MKCKFLSIAVSMSLLFSFSAPIVNVEAEPLQEWVICNENVPFENTGILEGIDSISIKNSVIIDGTKNLFYPTFDNKDVAMNNVKSVAGNVLNDIASIKELEVLCDNNWESYSDAVWSYSNNDLCDEIDILKSFFDIYENESVNNKIILCLEQGNSISDIEEELFYLLPYKTPFVTEISEEKANGISMLSAFDVDAAISYARAYAVHENGFDYEIFSSDCTNFASQIMENAGINQDDDLQWAGVGWWHVKDGNSHYHSNSWIRANDFARYMGVIYTTTSHYNFSANLQAGDFILIDLKDDGDWNHVGFVIQVDDYLTNGYYDYFVAQHSSNYLAWTSSSSNSWDIQESQGNSYGIIRK